MAIIGNGTISPHLNPDWVKSTNANAKSLTRQLSYIHCKDTCFVVSQPMIGFKSHTKRGTLQSYYTDCSRDFLPLQIQFIVRGEASFRKHSIQLLQILAMHIEDKRNIHYEKYERSGIAVTVTDWSNGEKLALWRWTPEDGWEVPTISHMSVTEFSHVLGKAAEKPLVSNCSVWWSVMY